MKVYYILLALALIFESSCLYLRKETSESTAKTSTDSTSKYADYYDVEIAEPPTVEQQIHSGENITPEYVYPSEQRFKETDNTAKEQTDAKAQTQAQTVLVHKYDNYITPEYYQNPHPVENGYFTPDYVHRFKESDNTQSATNTQTTANTQASSSSQTLLVHKYDNYITPEYYQNPHPVENGYFTPDIVHRFKEAVNSTDSAAVQTQTQVNATSQASTAENTTQPFKPKDPEASGQTTLERQFMYPIVPAETPEDSIPENYEEVAKGGLSDYAIADLARINAGFPKELPEKKDPNRPYANSPEIYRHIIVSHVTDVQTSKSDISEQNKLLWHDFVPKDGRKYLGIDYASDPMDVEQPSTMQDQYGKSRDYYANILNYPVQVDVEKTTPPLYQDQQQLVNIPNPMKTGLHESTYDKTVDLYEHK